VLQPSPLKKISSRDLRGEGQQGIDTMKTFSGKIESQDDWNGNSPSLRSSLYSRLILCPIVWSQQSITQLVVVDRVICLPWDHSVDDNSAVPSDIYSSDWRDMEVKHNSPFSNSNVRGWCLSSRGHFWRETSFGVCSNMIFTYLSRRKGWVHEACCATIGT
jgi:hypothetical protein